MTIINELDSTCGISDCQKKVSRSWLFLIKHIFLLE